MISLILKTLKTSYSSLILSMIHFFIISKPPSQQNVNIYQCSVPSNTICVTFFINNHNPTFIAPGPHQLEIATWKPSGSLTDSLSQHFLGGAHQLKSSELIFSRWADTSIVHVNHCTPKLDRLPKSFLKWP